MSYDVYLTETFNELYHSLDKNEKNWIENIITKLKENPAGKPLHFNWFREKRYLNKRLYYLIDEDSKRILVVAFATKKDQQKVINFIIKNMQDLLFYLKNL